MIKLTNEEFKMFYALSDKATGEYPREYTSGFANTKYVICFKTKKERDKWLSETKLLTAKALTRKEAIKLSDWVTYSPDNKEGYDKIKACQLIDSNNPSEFYDHIIISIRY